MPQPLVAPVWVTRLRHDAGIVATARQDEVDIRVEQVRQLENGTPRRHVVGHRSQCEHRNLDVLDMDRPAIDLETALRQIIAELKLAQIF